MLSSIAVGIIAAAAFMSVGCKSTPASPFNNLQGQPIRIYRLQNYSTAAAVGAAPTDPISGLLSSLPIPTEFQPQVQQAQGMICGLVPTMPGCSTAAVGNPVMPSNTFENYTIIGEAMVMDSSARDDLIDIFGSKKSFQQRKASCFYPEFGLAFGSGQTANVLISYSCNQAQSKNFQWPHPESGLTEKTVKSLNTIIQKAFGG